MMRRVATLLNQVAVTMEDSAGLQSQIDNAVRAAKQQQEDKLTLKQVRNRVNFFFLILFLFFLSSNIIKITLLFFVCLFLGHAHALAYCRHTPCCDFIFLCFLLNMCSVICCLNNQLKLSN